MKPLRKVILLIRSIRESERDALRGIMQFSQIHGSWTLYQEPPNFMRPLPLRSRIARMRAWKADGLIGSQDRMEEIRALALPSVIAEYEESLPPRAYQIVADNPAIGRMGAEHLLGLGFSHFAFCGLAGMHWSQRRCDGFTEAIVRAGGQPYVYTLPKALSGASWYSAQKPLGRWLVPLPKPIGLMTCNDDLAMMLAEVCRNQGIPVPNEVAIIGVDNDELVCSGSTPPLTSVALSTQRAGYDAAELLEKLMAGTKVLQRQVLIRPTHIVVRQSTDLIAVKDSNLVKAIRFIRENANRVIQVRDVATAAGLCKRTLEYRFSTIVGQTVLQEIARTRIQHISRLLTETHLPVAEIAHSMGYPDDDHIGRFFSRHTGLTPLTYRRQHGRV